MINEADEPSSACRLRRVHMVETSTPPKSNSPNYAAPPPPPQVPNPRSSTTVVERVYKVQTPGHRPGYPNRDNEAPKRATQRAANRR